MKLRSTPLLLALFVLFTLPALAGQKYDAIYVFGDSYCDTGNIYIATGGLKPLSPPYYQGRFSNGPLWVDHLAGSFKLPLVASLAGGTDYAFGGAELLHDVPIPGSPTPIPSVFHQVDLYLAAHGGKADPKALYILEGGGNDVLDAAGAGSPNQLGFEIGAGLASLELILRHAGATHFLIPNLFDVGLLPAGRANYGFDTTAIQASNRELAELLTLEDALEGIRIFSPDIYSLAHSIANDNSHYGFTDVTNPCLNTTTGAVCADPAHTLFWDADHPTEFGHSFLAIAAEAYVHP